MARGEWEVYVANEVRDWQDTLDATTHARVVRAIDTLADSGPGLGRPLVDTIHGSSMANLKELPTRHRPHPVRLRPLALQHPARSRRQSRKWNTWYLEAIPLAEQRYERYLKERTQEEEQR
jgi:hypothetical protein